MAVIVRVRMLEDGLRSSHQQDVSVRAIVRMAVDVAAVSMLDGAHESNGNASGR